MVTALANGAQAIIPVSEIADALEIRLREPGVLLAGERGGLKIGSDLADGVDFDLGNSPREFTAQAVRARKIVMTTTNGTRALKACAHSQQVLAGSFLNLRSTGSWVEKQPTPNLLIICGGTFEETAYEDVLGAGALCDLLWNRYDCRTDAAYMARRLFNLERPNLLSAVSESRNGRRLLSRAELHDDVAFCAQCDTQTIVAILCKAGELRAAV